jgi:hypothetical protein
MNRYLVYYTYAITKTIQSTSEIEVATQYLPTSNLKTVKVQPALAPESISTQYNLETFQDQPSLATQYIHTLYLHTSHTVNIQKINSWLFSHLLGPITELGDTGGIATMPAIQVKYIVLVYK